MSNVLQSAPREHSAIFSTFAKLPFVIKIFVLSIFEWPFTQTLLYQAFACCHVYEQLSLPRPEWHG